MILAPTKWSPRWHSNAKKWPKYGWTVEQIKVLWEATFSRKWQAAVFVGYWGMVRLRINEIEPLHKRMGHSGCLWGWLCATSDLLHHIVGWGWPHHNMTRHDDRLFQSTHASSFTAHCLALNHWCHYPDSHTKPLQVMPSNWEHANILFFHLARTNSCDPGNTPRVPNKNYGINRVCQPMVKYVIVSTSHIH